MKNYLFPLLVLGVLLTNCEDPIDVPSPFESSTLVVDAWLNNESTTQTIRITESIDYFQGGVPPTISGATVTVCRNSGTVCFEFTESESGVYEWQPEEGERLGERDDVFNLDIQVRDRHLAASTVLKRTAEIDSVAVNFEEESLIFDEGLYVEVYARDLAGQGDTYWMKAWKNDTLLSRTTENILSYDGAFDAGTDIDGSYFLPPLRAINVFDDEESIVPYAPGDSLYVEIHSISNVAWSFLSIAFEQIENTGIFALPIANSVGNIRDEESGELILGIFNVAEVVSASVLIE